MSVILFFVVEKIYHAIFFFIIEKNYHEQIFFSVLQKKYLDSIHTFFSLRKNTSHFRFFQETECEVDQK